MESVCKVTDFSLGFVQDKKVYPAVNHVDFEIHEDNQNQGAWAPEERIHFKKEQGVPECLKRNMTAGKAGIYGRINCKEFCDIVRDEARKR